MSIKKSIFIACLKMGKRKERLRNAQNKPFDVEKSRKSIEILNKLIGWLQPVRNDIKREMTHVDGMPGVHIDNPSSTQRVILYLHGGAYIKGLKHLSSLYHYFSAELAVACEAEVWMPDYRLAPEYPYPAALEDVYAAYQSLLSKGVEPRHLFVIGDSAGGGLTLALLMKLRDEGKPLPKAAVTLSAWTDLALTGESMIKRDDLDPMLSYKPVSDVPPLIIQKGQEKDPYISPLYGNYKNFPPLMMLVGGQEILYDDTLRVVEKAKKAGVNVTLEIEEEMPHVYPVFAGILPEGKKAIEHISLFVKKNVV
ncbi:MAG: alpha/beta hydrolase [Alphaproteobacteria bacterium]|nr:alpha/beta hydrolase [Alphaproteobacteria bacterium]